MFVLNTLCDLICDVISCCVWSCDMDKINVYDYKIVMENQKKEQYEYNVNL